MIDTGINQVRNQNFPGPINNSDPNETLAQQLDYSFWSKHNQ